MQLTALIVPTFINQVGSVSGWLGKAETFVTKQHQSLEDLLTLRLAPDMFPLATQLRFFSFQIQEAVFRLRGETIPDHLLEIRKEGLDCVDRGGTWPQARACISATGAFLSGIGPHELDGCGDKPIVHHLPTGMVFEMTGEEYVRDWAFPQVGFHHMIIYAILRHAKVALGKADYVPHMFSYIRKTDQSEA